MIIFCILSASSRVERYLVSCLWIMLKSQSQSGTALLLAMLVMAGILTVSVATSKLVINEIVQSSQLDRAIVAFYSSESGIERGLFQARQKDFSAVAFNGISADLDNNASYQLIAEDTEDALYASLLEDESFQVDLFEPHSLSALENPIKAVIISWQGLGSWLEIKWTSWTTSGVLGDPWSVYISQASSPYVVQLYDAGSYLYRLRVMARNAPADDIEIRAYNNVDPLANCQPLVACQVPIPARVSIKSLGEYPSGSSKASRQAILITMPEKSPLSGLYDYVLYSEEEVKKEN